MQLSLSQALLILVFRAARHGRRPNLTSFCRRSRVGVEQLEGAFELLERRGLMSFDPQGERLTLEGLALAAALSKRLSAAHRPLAACRPLAA